jgi:hypothetical protein
VRPEPVTPVAPARTELDLKLERERAQAKLAEQRRVERELGKRCAGNWKPKAREKIATSKRTRLARLDLREANLTERKQNLERAASELSVRVEKARSTSQCVEAQAALDRWLGVGL